LWPGGKAGRDEGKAGCGQGKNGDKSLFNTHKCDEASLAKEGGLS
jgi:hypothetical protein